MGGRDHCSQRVTRLGEVQLVSDRLAQHPAVRHKTAVANATRHGRDLGAMVAAASAAGIAAATGVNADPSPQR